MVVEVWRRRRRRRKRRRRCGGGGGVEEEEEEEEEVSSYTTWLDHGVFSVRCLVHCCDSLGFGLTAYVSFLGFFFFVHCCDSLGFGVTA